MSLLGGVLGGAGDALGNVGDAVDDVLGLDVDGAVENVGDAVGDVGDIVVDTARVLLSPGSDDPEPEPEPTTDEPSSPPPTSSTSSTVNRPPQTTTTRPTRPPGSAPTSKPASSSPPPQDEPATQTTPPDTTNSSEKPPVTPRPIALPASPDDGDDPPSSEGSSNSPINHDSTSADSSNPSLPSVPIGGDPSGPGETDTPGLDADTSSGPNKAVVGTLATLGTLLALFALFCLIRFFLIRKRRQRRDEWTKRPLTWGSPMPADYSSTAATWDEKTPATRIQSPLDPHSPTSIPDGWVDVEALHPPAALHRDSNVSVQSYGNLTLEALAVNHSSAIYSSSISSGVPSLASPIIATPAPAVVVTSRWSGSSPTESPRNSTHSDSSSGSLETTPLAPDSRFNVTLAYASQSAASFGPAAPEPVAKTIPRATSPQPATGRSAQSALMTALFPPMIPASPLSPNRAASIKHVPDSTIQTATTRPLARNLPTPIQRSPSWTPPESWGSPAPSPTPPMSPTKPRSASGLFVDEDPFASPLDRA